jgi:hypothetical protein
MSTHQQRLAAAAAKRLSLILSHAANLDFQMSELNRLRDRLRQAEVRSDSFSEAGTHSEPADQTRTSGLPRVREGHSVPRFRLRASRRRRSRRRGPAAALVREPEAAPKDERNDDHQEIEDLVRCPVQPSGCEGKVTSDLGGRSAERGAQVIQEQGDRVDGQGDHAA